MRTLIKWAVIVLGLAAVVFGVIFIVQSGPARQQVADSIAPLPLGQVNSTYDSVTTKQQAIRAQEEPNIQAGKAAPSTMYNYLTVQRASLGLAKTSIGLADLIQMVGIVNIIVGAGLLLAGLAVPNKK